jgi:hypothetical protein
MANRKVVSLLEVPELYKLKKICRSRDSGSHPLGAAGLSANLSRFPRIPAIKEYNYFGESQNFFNKPTFCKIQGYHSMPPAFRRQVIEREGLTIEDGEE